MIETSYNPDVLTCLANLSNDEVFTPPSVVNDMLDLLPSDLWSNPKITFLDPVSKSGVFLREITKRLDKGLETQIPNKQDRINHILMNQVFGIAITELTSLLSRRSLYCSKIANGQYSLCTEFSDDQGNLRFERMDHTWNNGKCKYCGANQTEYDRGEELESYAYNFIHTDKPENIFNMTSAEQKPFHKKKIKQPEMKFDVIVGNPPYQLGSDGGNRDIPIYNKFIEQAKKLNPKFLCMIIPSRWMAGGLGLSNFRQDMLSDKRIKYLVDFPMANEVFNGVEIKGGVCYFLWDIAHNGSCQFTTIRNGDKIGPIDRDLNQFDVLVRDVRGISILKKVQTLNEPSITEILSVDKEFGWTSNFTGFNDKKNESEDAVELFYIRSGKRYTGWIERKKIKKSTHLIDKWKVMIPKAGSDGGKKIPDIVLGKPLIAGTPSVCTQSYLFFYSESEKAALSIQGYYKTKFFRFLVSLRKFTQDATRSSYTWVPIQNWGEAWTDEKLYAKYNLTDDEITFIESMIRPMDLSQTLVDHE